MNDIPTLRVPRLALTLAGVIVLLLLLVELGFPLSDTGTYWLLVITNGALWAAVIAELWRMLAEPRRWSHVRRHWIEAGGTFLLLAALIAKPWCLPAIRDWWPDLNRSNIESLYLGALQLAVIIRLVYRGLYFNQFLAFAGISPRMILIGSFLGLIALGTLLLKLPRATTGAEGIAWIDALFTSTSAVCVTGLIVVDTATAFSGLGKTVILVLFQLGGLGIMTFAYFFVLVLRGVTLRDRTMLLDFLNEDHAGGITRTLAAIVVMTFAFESLGAVLLHAAADAFVPGATDWFDSVFHSVSAFCNAGFSTYSLGLFDPLTRGNAGYQWTIIILIIIGGIGFPVLKNLWESSWSRIKAPRFRPVRITTHSKTVLVTTAALLAGGAIVFLGFEYFLNGRQAWSGQTLPAIFLSVTSRTAGFNTVPTELLAPASAMVVIFLMFIGGGPAGTAGGIKVTTFAIALLNTIRILRRSGGELVAFGRRIPEPYAIRAFAIALLAIVWVAGSSLALMVLMPGHPPLDIVFESVSAFATAGLSRGITADLPDAGKLVIAAGMIVGRIGILYVAVGVFGGGSRARISYPEANVIIS